MWPSVALAFTIAVAPGQEGLPPLSDGWRTELRGPVTLPGGFVRCPAFGWEYSVCFEGLGGRPGQQTALRFRVYAPGIRESVLAKSVARSLLRLWEASARYAELDNPIRYGRVVHVFLAEGGRPGGEQMFVPWDTASGSASVNAVYIYSIQSFRQPTEMFRELAHEYGHAVLPAYGGFTQPERFGNGVLGEHLLPILLLREHKTDLKADDMMGMSSEQLEEWCRTRSYPLADAAWKHGPNPNALESRDLRGMHAMVGVCLLLAESSSGTLARAFALSSSLTAKGLLDGVRAATSEFDAVTYRVPARLKGTMVFVPCPAGFRVVLGKEIARTGDWAKVVPSEDMKVKIQRIGGPGEGTGKR